jgi:hypothetical protein
MKKDWKYILYVVLAISLFVVIKMISPKQYDWNITFNHEDKNPYGGYVLNQLLPEIFASGKIEHSFQSLYEIKDSLKKEGNLLIIASNFNCDDLDTKALLAFVNNGGSAFISAQSFYGKLRDTLKIRTADYYFLDHDWFSRKDTTHLRFVNPAFDTAKIFAFKKDNIYNFFSGFDTTRTSVITRNDKGRPVTIQVKWGKGTMILNSTPMVFTNIYLLANENHEFVSNSLSYLPAHNLQWTEFYQVGRREIRTPLRFILKTESLRWAYYLTIITLLVFMVFEMKRRQRIIPVLKPLDNTTLEFVGTIGNLYYQNKEHSNIAEKKIVFFLEQIRAKYFLSTTKIDADFLESLSLKSGKPKEDVVKLFDTINAIRSQKSISVSDLISLNEQIEIFNK